MINEIKYKYGGERFENESRQREERGANHQIPS